MSRKLRGIIGILVCLALAEGLAACGKESQKEEEVINASKADMVFENMSLQDKVEQLMFVSYRTWDESGVTQLNDEMIQMLQNHKYGGTLFFAENFVDAEQTVKLVSDFQKNTNLAGGVPLFVAVDQEGGSVSRIGFGTKGVGNMALAATDDVKSANIMASIYGEEMSLLGVNVDFAPVVDVNNNPNNPVIGVRSFSDDPELVSEFGTAYMEGLHEQNIVTTAKHFPGHGNVDTDSHTGFPLVNSSYEELKKCELIPFQKMIDEGVDMIMTAHIQYPNIESETYTSITTGEQVYLPATMSKTILTDILRNDMGFDGVIVSDALEMAAISDNFAMEDVLCMTINAGVNMLILPVVTDSASLNQTQETIDLAVKLVEEGKIDIDKVDDSVKRILSLKEEYGMLEDLDFELTQDATNAATNGVGSTENREVAWSIAEAALTVVKNDNNAFPLNLSQGDDVLVLFADSCANRIASVDMAKQVLSDNMAVPDGVNITAMANTKDNAEECVQAAKTAKHVILVHRMYSADNLNPDTEDGVSSAVFDRIINERHASGQQVILISCQLPYDAARFLDSDAIVLTYNSNVMKELLPQSGEGSAYMPNLPAAICACMGYGEASGKLPVDIPKLDDTYGFTDEILFSRSI
ncbi:MAG: hypothetical protein E7242_03180 [Lachnospiraceae bacterium]|nr:hypothetical protein [Lachnospiraceae bacterium]